MESMGFEIFITFLVVVTLPSYINTRINRVLAQQSKIISMQKGGQNEMSKLINNLVGKQCMILKQGEVVIGNDKSIIYTVVEADGEWVKLQQEHKKKGIITKYMRIADIDIIEERCGK